MDPRSPYVLSTHDLGRAPGTMRKVERTVPALTDLGTPVMTVPAESEITLDLQLEAVMDGVFVTGEVEASTHAECVRCLRDVDGPMSVTVGELYHYPGAREAALAEGDEEAEDMLEVQDELLDLEPLLRDAVVTAMPLNPLCEPDCAGLCPGCGERLADLPADHEHVQVDPRWAALSGLLAGTDDATGTDDAAGSTDDAAGGGDE